MKLSTAGVVASAGTLRAPDGVHLEHAWTAEGVTATAVTNGAQALHLSVALCVLNDTYREAAALGVSLAGVRVVADGAFDDAWRSTGIAYEIDIDSDAPTHVKSALLDRVDDVAEIPKALRAGAPVTRRR